VKTDTAKANFKNETLEISFETPQTAKKRRVEIGEEVVSSKKGDTAA
jgi:HSP20 family molecular chaperone IbpA